MMSNGSGQQGLSCPWRSVQKNSLGLGNTQRFKDLWMFDGQFDDFLDLFDLLIESSDHVVGGVRHFLNFHQGDKGIDLGG